MWKDMQVGIKWEKQSLLAAYFTVYHRGNWQVEKKKTKKTDRAQQVEGQENLVANGSDCSWS